MISLTNEEKDLLSYVDTLIPANGHLQLNFSDPKQYAIAELLTKKNFDTKKYPGKLESLKRQKAIHSKYGVMPRVGPLPLGWEDLFAVSGLGKAVGLETVASNGIGTAVGGYSNMNLMLFVQDNVTKNIVASGVNHDFAGFFLPVNTIVGPQGSTDLNVTAFLYYSYTPNGASSSQDDSPTIDGFVKRDASNGTTADPVLTAPVRTCINPTDPNALNIGVGRPWSSQGGSSGFDYAWNEQVSSSPIGKIPFVGSVIFNQPIRPLIAGTTILLDIYVANQSGGGGTRLNATNLANVYNNFSIDPNNPNKLNWNLRPGVNTSDPGNPITFGNVTWPSNLEAFFYCGILVILQDGTPANASVQSQTTPDDDPLDGVLGIMPISFIWHCLGEDTLVSMADSTTKPIAEIIAGDKVKIDNKGGIALVEWTNKGIHTGSISTIITNDGNKIVASHNHVFLSGNGPVLASELKTGDTLEAIEGNATVVTVDHQSIYEGMLYNIATRGYQDPENFDGKIVAFYANGFHVGDVNAQQAFAKLRSNDIEWVKKQVPEYLHIDVDSFFRDKASKK